MTARRVPNPAPVSVVTEARAARDYDVRMTCDDGSTIIHKSRASSSALALRLAVDVVIRTGVMGLVKLEVV